MIQCGSAALKYLGVVCDQVDLLSCLEKRSTDVLYKKRMGNRFKSGLLSAGSVADLIADDLGQTCLLCLSPVGGKYVMYSRLAFFLHS